MLCVNNQFNKNERMDGIIYNEMGSIGIEVAFFLSGIDYYASAAKMVAAAMEKIELKPKLNVFNILNLKLALHSCFLRHAIHTLK